MAGYLFTFSDTESLVNCINSGLYSTRMGLRWTIATEGTLGDFVSMKPGDNVYLFSKRLVYGIGEIIEIEPGKVVIDNRPSSTNGESFEYCAINTNPVMPEDSQKLANEGKVQRWLIAFCPSPHFFKTGIDMDDLLQSDPKAFKSLRVFWKRTFIKLDDEENTAFKAAILRRNIKLLHACSNDDCFECGFEESVREIRNDDKNLTTPDIKALLASKRSVDGSLNSEMMLEVGLLHELTEHSSAEDVFGHWDYLSHQVNASPMKAVDYMDKIDVFGYRWLTGYNNQIIEKYLVAELKKDTASNEDLAQLMKYVDWVCDEYASSDYLRLKAFLVARSFDLDSIKKSWDTIERNQIIGRRPAQNQLWNDVTLVTYEVADSGEMTFATVGF